MKLGVITTSYPRTPGDPAGSFVAAHVEALRTLGHDVEVIAAGMPGTRPRDSSLRGSRAGGSRPPAPITWVASSLFDHGGAPDHLERHPVRSLAAAALVAARMTLTVARRAQRWDSIVAHWLVPSALAALPTGVPVLAIAHGGDIHTLRRMKLLAPVLELLYRRDAQLAFVSEPLRAIAREAAPRLAAWLDTATVQPMGLDLARFSRVGHTPTHPPTIVIAARLVDIKGVDVAIAALAHLCAPVRLVIAGDGPERAKLEALARQWMAGSSEPHGAVETARRHPAGSSEPLGAVDSARRHPAGSSEPDGAIDPARHRPASSIEFLGAADPARRHAAGSIEFVGMVDTARRDALLRQASVVVVPSRVTPSGRTEGMPMIALEALAAGVPVVASAVGGLSGLAPPARLVRPDRPRELAAAIDQTLSEPPDAQLLRAAVAHLAWENVATRLVRNP